MKRIAALLAVAGLSNLPGCMFYQGSTYHMSLDKHNFVSTPHMPLTLDLQDTVTGENVWHLDIPVGKMAVVDFEHWDDWTAGQQPAIPAYKVSWNISDPGTPVGILDNSQQLSGRPVLLKVSIRDKAKVAEELAANPPTYTARMPWAEYHESNATSAYPPARAAAPAAPAQPSTSAPAEPAPTPTEPLAPAPVPPQPQFKPQPAPTSAPAAPASEPPAPAIVPPQPQFKPQPAPAAPAPAPSAPAAPAAPSQPSTPTTPGSPNPAANPNVPQGRAPLGADDTVQNNRPQPAEPQK